MVETPVLLMVVYRDGTWLLCKDYEASPGFVQGVSTMAHINIRILQAVLFLSVGLRLEPYSRMHQDAGSLHLCGLLGP